ncbi:hypothetical protein [Simkania sp.]|uniref:hypothetical protein n=1 Tax=Simkania sp. TaxID=34094 RepID=UPI003B51F599
MSNDALTKEAFKEIFEDNFEMTNYAIHLAQDQIHAGNEELNVTELLHEIRKHPPKVQKPVEQEEIATHE